MQGYSLDIIDEFVAQYTREIDFYERAARLARESLEQRLSSAGIRCIVTSRAKAIDRLKDKCRKRNQDGRYGTFADITADIADLAGVRVALYFPTESEQVDKMIDDLFDQTDVRREIINPPEPSEKKRFPGYSALHYRVKLKSDPLPDADKRYSEAKIEIQVASVLMHAWSEVEHDLSYKPVNGELSEDERASLDQLSGLVHAGEVALELLQRAGERRVENSSRPFSNRYELATYLLKRERVDQEIIDIGLGRVDVLYVFICRLDLNTPETLQPYLTSLHGNLEERALSEQIVDAILAQHPEHTDLYQRILSEVRVQTVEYDEDADTRRLFGNYVIEWRRLEEVLGVLAGSDWGHRNPAAIIAHLLKAGIIDADLRGSLDHARRTRNELIHGRAVANAAELDSEIQRVHRLIDELIARGRGSE